MKKKVFLNVKLIIIGSGPAGYTAGLYAARANISTILFEGPNPGGQLLNTSSIENWPGQFNFISGQELMTNMKKQVKNLHIKIINDTILKILTKKKKFIVLTKNNQYFSDSIIIATGAIARSLNISTEKKYLGKGVSTCAICDGYFYKNKPVAVIGGGNTAIENALYLSKISKIVYLIHRQNTFRAEKILIKRLMEKCISKKIIIFQPFILKKILGDNSGVSGIKIQSVIEKNNQILKIFGLFVSIGYIPNTQIFKNLLHIDSNGYIILNKKSKFFTTETNYPGIFAAGDVVDNVYKQAITAAANGCQAAMDVEKYLHIK
ncbi:thioredoxin-disulfide reductase [Buchnera aphidicola]|uniref:thioredoxin-disulfide reductase n=1 Tax=Buchnera aphidicola TaxID=9 RepID=UPI0031B6AB9D